MTEILQWLAWGVSALLSIVALPGTLLLLVLTVGAIVPGSRRKRPAQRPLRLCALVPAHNEEGTIERCVRSLLESGGPSFEVYVVADNCTDSTAAFGARAGAHVLVREDQLRRGKGYALNFAFEKLVAQGADAVLVVDADSIVSSNLVGTVSEYFIAGADAVQCRYRVLGKDLSIRNRLMDLAFLGFNVLRPIGRSRLGISAGVLGNGFALSKATLQQVPYVADSIVEDLEYHIHLVRAGLHVRFANEATVYGEMPMAGTAASGQRARWEGGRLRMLLQWFPRLATDVIRSRVNCIEPLIELLALPLGYQVFLLFVILAIGLRSFQFWAAAQILLVALHVVAAAFRGENFPSNLVVLLAAPFYVVWKIAMIPRIARASRPEANWLRTDRSQG